jgi:hypothetical protein
MDIKTTQRASERESVHIHDRDGGAFLIHASNYHDRDQLEEMGRAMARRQDALFKYHQPSRLHFSLRNYVLATPAGLTFENLSRLPSAV